jgi:hypothetical protein
MLTARNLKCSVMLEPSELLALAEPSTSRILLKINVAGRTITADVNAKAVRKVRATIREHGGDNVACLIQGKLVGDQLTEAGLVAQLKNTATPTPAIAVG